MEPLAIQPYTEHRPHVSAIMYQHIASVITFDARDTMPVLFRALTRSSHMSARARIVSRRSVGVGIDTVSTTAKRFFNGESRRKSDPKDQEDPGAAPPLGRTDAGSEPGTPPPLRHGRPSLPPRRALAAPRAPPRAAPRPTRSRASTGRAGRTPRRRAPSAGTATARCL